MWTVPTGGPIVDRAETRGRRRIRRPVAQWLDEPPALLSGAYGRTWALQDWIGRAPTRRIVEGLVGLDHAPECFRRSPRAGIRVVASHHRSKCTSDRFPIRVFVDAKHHVVVHLFDSSLAAGLKGRRHITLTAIPAPR